MPVSRKKRLAGTSAVLWLLSAIYTASPIDLIPDFIPILGLMDDGAGWMVTILFTLWAIRSVTKHGPAGIAKARETLTNLERRGEQLPRTSSEPPASYDPLGADEILAM